MEGLNRLLNLPIDIKQIIINEYVSVQNFYQLIFNLNSEEYKLRNSEDLRLKTIRNSLSQIGNRLEELGLNNAYDLITDISADFTEIIVKRRINELNNYLTPLGTDFDEMRSWLNNLYDSSRA